MNSHILVIGGAGYIGSHAVELLKKNGYEVTVLDDFSAGHREAIPDTNIIEGDLGDTGLLDDLFSETRFDCVMHFAALIFVGESEKYPLIYYENNVIKTFRLLEAMHKHRIDRFVFSSTAAVYGEPESIPIKEHDQKNPINPYGNTKRIAELMLADFAKASNLRFACLRYFNAAGADLDGKRGESHDPENHLIPLVLDAAAGKRPSIGIYGTDYDTSDGTCIRDYIHVNDLVNAHIMAIEALKDNQQLHLNLGTGKGFSVQEIIDTAQKVTGCKIPVTIEERRPGDPPQLIADPSQANAILNWLPMVSDIETIIASAWKWHQNRTF